MYIGKGTTPKRCFIIGKEIRPRIIVTCSECKNWKRPIEPDEIGYCYIDGRSEMKPTDYCSWAEGK